MKESYHEFYRPSEDDFASLWREAIIAFDASAILNLYFYSDQTTQSFLAVMRLLKDRIWLPYQAGLEYQRNRHGVLSKVSKGYMEAKKALHSFRSQIQARSQPPFLNNELVQRFEAVADEVVTAFDKVCESINARSSNDPIRDELDALFASRVGKPFTEKELASIYSEGKERYRTKTPPGYRDEKDKPGNDAFSDLVIWKELIEKGKAGKKPVIFVTDDGKEDWWLLHDDRTIGPRPELLKEFAQASGRRCYLYTSEGFLRYADQHLKATVDPNAIEEIQETIGPPSVVFRAAFNDCEAEWDAAKERGTVEKGVAAIRKATELLKPRASSFSDKERDALFTALYDADVLGTTAIHRGFDAENFTEKQFWWQGDAFFYAVRGAFERDIILWGF